MPTPALIEPLIVDRMAAPRGRAGIVVDSPLAFTNPAHLSNLAAQIGEVLVTSVAGRVGDVIITIADLDGLQASLDSKTTATYVDAQINALLNGAGAAYNTLKELQDLIVADESLVSGLVITVGTKADRTLSNLTNAATARTNLGLGTAALQNLDTTHRFITDGERVTWNNKQNAFGNATLLTGLALTYNFLQSEGAFVFGSSKVMTIESLESFVAEHIGCSLAVLPVASVCVDVQVADERNAAERSSIIEAANLGFESFSVSRSK